MIIKTEQAKGGKIKLYCDGEYRASFDSSFWYSFSFFDGDEIDEERLQELINEEKGRRALQAAMSLLSRRSYSLYELKQKLRQKDFDEESREYAAERCAEMKLLDDEDYAARLAESLAAQKGYSAEKIKYELRLRGIDRDIIENTVESLDNDPIECIINLLETKYSRCEKSEKEKRRVFQSLMRLGYKSEDIKSAFRRADDWRLNDFYDE